MMETGKQEQDMHNLLVVDDEEVIREGMRRILEAEGYHVTTSASRRTAIEKIQERDFNMVITDLKMPGMGGIEVVEAVLQAGQINPSGQRNRVKNSVHAASSGNISTNPRYVFG
jgi:CheY-like chemotaxis protein